MGKFDLSGNIFVLEREKKSYLFYLGMMQYFSVIRKKKPAVALNFANNVLLAQYLDNITCMNKGIFDK
jgi:hypothetical protein